MHFTRCNAHNVYAIMCSIQMLTIAEALEAELFHNPTIQRNSSVHRSRSHAFTYLLRAGLLSAADAEYFIDEMVKTGSTAIPHWKWRHQSPLNGETRLEPLNSHWQDKRDGSPAPRSEGQSSTSYTELQCTASYDPMPHTQHARMCVCRGTHRILNDQLAACTN